ncbi:hypothetical protein CI610_00824 [invertebrate metagenome]|uniref:Uncharacterized protein n=1 Tax=invertebrate metagenome TaxID=1711999 RepID=A0A2H9TAD5_9ZZZZ
MYFGRSHSAVVGFVIFLRTTTSAVFFADLAIFWDVCQCVSSILDNLHVDIAIVRYIGEQMLTKLLGKKIRVFQLDTGCNIKDTMSAPQTELASREQENPSRNYNLRAVLHSQGCATFPCLLTHKSILC